MLRRSSGSRSSKAVLDGLTVQRSRSFGFAKTVSNTLQVRVARLRIAYRWGEIGSLSSICAVDTTTQEALLGASAAPSRTRNGSCDTFQRKSTGLFRS